MTTKKYGTKYTEFAKMSSILDEMVARRMENTGETFEEAARNIARYLKENHSPNK